MFDEPPKSDRTKIHYYQFDAAELRLQSAAASQGDDNHPMNVPLLPAPAP
jgi:hypothetical protein